MHSQFNYVYGYEIAKARQAEILKDVQQCRNGKLAAKTEDREWRRFYRAYQMRSLLFRLAPDWASRMGL